MSDAVKPGLSTVHKELLALLERMMTGDPSPDTPEGRLLASLGAAIETYERETLVRPFGDLVDWGEVDDELHRILAEYTERRDGANTEHCMSELRALMRKVSGE